MKRQIAFGNFCSLVLLTFVACSGPVETPPEETTEPSRDVSPHAIIFQSERGGAVDVWQMGSDGSDPVNLTGNSAKGYNDRHPTGSPDGSKIAFRSDRDGSPDVFVMNADGSEQVNLTAHDSSNIDPSFSADGARIAFDSERDGNLEIYVMTRRRLDTNAPHRKRGGGQSSFLLSCRRSDRVLLEP